MAEYIEREAVEEIMKKHRCSDCTNEKSLDCPLCQLHRPFDEISKLPTADVVPKSEVEKLKSDLLVWKQDRFNLYQRLELYKITRQKVAREIFEDIDGKMLCFFPSSSFVNAPHTTHYQLLAMLAELKKKYAE